MQEMMSGFSTTMTWVVLSFCLVAVVLLGVSACFLSQGRRRALLGVMAMALVWAMAGISQVLLSQKGSSMARLLLPLVAPILMFSLYRLSFPPHIPVQTNHQNYQRYLLLLLLTLGTLITTIASILLDLFF